MLQESHDDEQIIARVAALDIGKAELVCCVRVPAPDSARKRLQEVSTQSTMTGSLIELANRLVELRVERVVMEATSEGVSFHLCKSGVVHHRTAVGRTEGVFCDQDHADAG